MATFLVCLVSLCYSAPTQSCHRNFVINSAHDNRSLIRFHCGCEREKSYVSTLSNLIKIDNCNFTFSHFKKLLQNNESVQKNRFCHQIHELFHPSYLAIRRRQNRTHLEKFERRRPRFIWVWCATNSVGVLHEESCSRIATSFAEWSIEHVTSCPEKV